MKLFFILVVLIAAFAVICSAGRSRFRSNRQRTSNSNRPSTHSNPPSVKRSPISDRKSGRQAIPPSSDKNPNNNWAQKSNKNPKSSRNKNSKSNSKVDLENIDSIDFPSSSENVFESDYCNMHCESNNPPEKHIGCNPNHNFAPRCNDTTELVEMTDDLKQLLVDLHNENRNITAGGGDKNHGKACRMATMQWDEELAYLATLDVKRCITERDNCHNTEAFKSAGQIKGFLLNKSPWTYDDSTTLTMLVNLLFSEFVSNTAQSVIDSNPEYSYGVPLNEMAALVTDRNTHLGCAALTFYDNPYYVYMLNCNYATQGQIGRAIYTGCGEKDPKCTSKSERLYSNLCPLDEEYDVNN